MSHQLTFADSEFSSKRRQTRKEIFLSRMEQILPWQNMVEVIEPFYPKAGNGRRPYPLETMLRIHCMQHWYNLSDGAMEDALYEIASMRLFARLSLDSALPDRTTIMNFRHLLEQHQLARQLFKTINRWLAEAGVMMTQGTLVDATIIEAPSSTKNKEQQRDPEMHQTKKGNQWHFGMKAHIGVDAKSGLTHSLVTTAANEHDLNQLGNLLHGEEQFVSADAGYQGAPQREELAEVDVDWLIAERPGKVRTLKQHPRKNKTAINIEYMKASIRARVEHPFRIIKRQFGFVKARYKGLLKNDIRTFLKSYEGEKIYFDNLKYDLNDNDKESNKEILKNQPDNVIKEKLNNEYKLRFRMMQTILQSRVNVLPYINEQRLNKLNPPENLRIAIEHFGWKNRPITA